MVCFDPWALQLSTRTFVFAVIINGASLHLVTATKHALPVKCAFMHRVAFLRIFNESETFPSCSSPWGMKKFGNWPSLASSHRAFPVYRNPANLHIYSTSRFRGFFNEAIHIKMSNLIVSICDLIFTLLDRCATVLVMFPRRFTSHKRVTDFWQWVIGAKMSQKIYRTSRSVAPVRLMEKTAKRDQPQLCFWHMSNPSNDVRWTQPRYTHISLADLPSHPALHQLSVQVALVCHLRQ